MASLRTIPCKDVSRKGDDFDAFLQKMYGKGNTRWSIFQSFLDDWAQANEAAPLETQRETFTDIKYLRIYGCDYLKNSSLWDSFDSYEAWKADARSNNSTVKSPYWLGRNLCVRGRGHKPLSLFCPEACGCHRGDEDCPLQCPERNETTPVCPAHQWKNFVIEGKDATWYGYRCPRMPQAHSFDVGVSVRDARAALSRPAPPTNCAAASTGACLESAWDGSGGLIVDTGCCAPCGKVSCAHGYTYAGQILFDSKMLSTTYPDFSPVCGEGGGCGNTCCVPSDERDGARAAAGD